MFEVKGKNATAICFAKIVEEEALNQIQRMCDSGVAKGSKIRIMPDVHAGKGCTIGTTMTITDKVVPNIVGVDIGCGMYTVRLLDADIDFEKVDEACHIIPSGFNVWESARWSFDLTELRCYEKLKNPDRLKRSLGTLGGGNHFIEIDASLNNMKHLVIHSGSRNLGKQVADYYQNLAVELTGGRAEYLARRAQVIEEYKNAGREKEIQSAINALKREEVPDDLCYLQGKHLNDYLHDAEVCQRFARENRERIAEVILNHTGLESHGGFHTIHNYIDTDEMILRKGAIAAHKGELVLIPINMRDGSIIALGKGNPDWNYSAPHGAGRIMSRAKAKNTIGMEEYIKSMEGIYTTSINPSTLDEAPMAYKSLEDIIDVVKESVNVIEVLKPIFNYKDCQ